MEFDPLFNSYKVKFSILEVLFKDIDVKEIIQEVNIFINLESIFSMFHREYVEEKLRVMEKKEMAMVFSNLISNIINLSAHYRLFFTRNKIRTTIVYYYNEPDTYYKYNNEHHVDEYRKRYSKNYSTNLKFETLNGIISEAMKMTSFIIDNLDNIFLINTVRIESSVIPHLLVKEKKVDGQINILITKDLYDLQYANNNYLVLYPQKEESKLITKNNLIKFICDKESITNIVPQDIPSEIYSFMIAAVGDKKRDIKGLKGVGTKTILKIMSKLFNIIDARDPSSVSIESLINVIKEDETNANKNRDKVYKNYLATDLERQYKVIPKSQKLDIFSQLVNKYDNASLKQINARYFDTSPIQLMELNNYCNKRKSVF